VIIGKIILDIYGDPDVKEAPPPWIGDDGTVEADAIVTIGGGGPQAAWGACASLAARDAWREVSVGRRDLDTSPPRQDVTFLAPIGSRNWSESMTRALDALLPMLRTPPILVTSTEHVTPTIRIWHDANEIVHWTPMDDSFGMEGADGLWRDRPSAMDVIHAIGGGFGDDDDDDDDDRISTNDDDDDGIVLHAILEAGYDSAGDGCDASPLYSRDLMGRVAYASVEPIVFLNGDTGIVSGEDANRLRSIINDIEASLFESSSRGGGNTKINDHDGSHRHDDDDRLLMISPDRPCYDALVSCLHDVPGAYDDDASRGGGRGGRIEFAVRHGRDGSVVDGLHVPAASLITPDGMPINPSGAGNAYSGAYAACRGTGSTMIEAACLANAVGAVVCEYDNLPPWTWEVLDRIVEACREVRGRIREAAVD
jgi:hypothetical protein